MVTREELMERLNFCENAIRKMMTLGNTVRQCNAEVEEQRHLIALCSDEKVWKEIVATIVKTIIAGIIGLVGGGFIVQILAYIFHIPGSTQDGMMLVISGIASLITLLRGIGDIKDVKDAPQRIARFEEELAEKKQKLDSVKKELVEYRGSVEWSKAVSYIPKDYFYLSAIEKIRSFVKNGRADTMKEALDLYEEYLHREKMEYEAKRAADEAQRAADNAEMTAIAAQEATEYAKITAEKAQSMEYLAQMNAYRTTTVQNNVDIDITFE